jgi:hypothetical protein
MMRGVVAVAVVLAVGAPAAAQNLGKTFAFDFRKDKGLKDQFRPAAREGEKFVTQEPQGLKIVLPGGGAKRPVAGLVPKWRVHGDFEITLSYEGLKSPRPSSGSGPRLSIYARRSTERGEAVSIERLARAEDGDVFLAHTAYTDRDGKRRTTSNTSRATAADGKLQLKRTGPTVQFLVADGPGGALREVHQADWGPEDLDVLRFGVDSGDSTQPFEVRIPEVSVAATGLPVGPPSRLGASWQLWAALAVLVALGVGGVWYWRRASRRTEAPQPQPEAVAPKAPAEQPG